MKKLSIPAICFLTAFLPLVVSAQRLETGPGSGVDPIIFHNQLGDYGTVEIYVGSNSLASGVMRIFWNENGDVDSVRYTFFAGALGSGLLINHSTLSNTFTKTTAPLPKGYYILCQYRVYRRKA